MPAKQINYNNLASVYSFIKPALLKYVILFTIVIINKSEASAQIKPLFQAEGVLADSTTGGLVLPKLHITLDKQDRLYYQDSLLFDPAGKPGLSIYEVAGDNYILVSLIDSQYIHSEIIYLLGKKEVWIFKCGGELKSWHLQLNGKKVLGIKKDRLILVGTQSKDEHLKAVKEYMDLQ